MRNDFEKLKISPMATLFQAMEQMDIVGHKLLMVYDVGEFVGLISIGAIQRALIKGAAPKDVIKGHMSDDIVLCSLEDSEETIKSEMLRCRAEYMPIVKKDKSSGRKYVVNIVFWDDLFVDGYSYKKDCEVYDLPVVIMAGGEGSRLRPLTNLVPKPLLPISDKTIIEMIIERFAAIGCRRFFISLNYMADVIEQYLISHNEGNYEFVFFREDRPLGSGGSLSLIKERIKETFFVTNCDNILRQDLTEIVKAHRQNKNEMTVVAAVKGMTLSYGNLVVEADERVVKVEEKPELLFRVNTGVYVMEPELLKEVPAERYFPMTDLMNIIIARNGRVGCFPITDGSWCDVGNWEDYMKLLGKR